MMDATLDSIWDDPALREKPPILVDVGASGEPPPAWMEIASRAIYVGFDPDLRAMRDSMSGRFIREIMVNDAIVTDPSASRAKFFLTHSPYCSSTLKPDFEGLEHYIFSDLFQIVGESEVSATTLDRVLERLELPGIDWLKIDTQGTDLRVFESLAERTRAGVLAIDVEPGLIDAYEGEDLFIDVHRSLTKEGFWLSDLNVNGAVRVRRATLDRVMAENPDLNAEMFAKVVPKSPGWTEARYLRTIESLQKRDAPRRDYLLLWSFALSEKQFGFALDIAMAYEDAFEGDAVPANLRLEPLRLLRTHLTPPPEPPSQAAQPQKLNKSKLHRFLNAIRTRLTSLGKGVRRSLRDE